jgi:hypothetical protein
MATVTLATAHEGIDLAEMRGKLLTLEDVRERLAATEPIGEHTFPVGSGVEFEIDPGWAEQCKPGTDMLKTGTDVLEGTVLRTPGGGEYRLTRDALLEAGAAVGIPRKLQERLPSRLLQDPINWWFRGGADKSEYKLLAMGEEPMVLAMCRPTVSPFSNLRLLDEMLRGIEGTYGRGTEVLADYKFHHDLETTHMRLVIPGHERRIEGTGFADDTWCAGIQLKNYLTGLHQTEIDAYHFRWWCTNGCYDQLATGAGSFSRRRGGSDPEDAYEWARQVVDEVLGGLEHGFDAIQSLTEVSVRGNTSEVLGDLFARHDVPVRERQRVIANMVEDDQLTMYSIQQAITQAANAEDVTPRAADQLMALGGLVARVEHARCSLGYVHEREREQSSRN